jgi:hypothetical protein
MCGRLMGAPTQGGLHLIGPHTRRLQSRGTQSRGPTLKRAPSKSPHSCVGDLLEVGTRGCAPTKWGSTQGAPAQGGPTKEWPTQGSPYSMGPHPRGPHSRKPPFKGAHTQRVEALLYGGSLVGVCFCAGPLIVGAPIFVGALGGYPSRPCLNPALPPCTLAGGQTLEQQLDCRTTARPRTATIQDQTHRRDWQCVNTVQKQ